MEGLTCVREREMGVSVGEMEARKELHPPPNRCWPNHHREFFAFGREKRDELCVRKQKKTGLRVNIPPLPQRGNKWDEPEVLELGLGLGLLGLGTSFE